MHILRYYIMVSIVDTACFKSMDFHHVNHVRTEKLGFHKYGNTYRCGMGNSHVVTSRLPLWFCAYTIRVATVSNSIFRIRITKLTRLCTYGTVLLLISTGHVFIVLLTVKLTRRRWIQSLHVKHSYLQRQRQSLVSGAQNGAWWTLVPHPRHDRVSRHAARYVVTTSHSAVLCQQRVEYCLLQKICLDHISSEYF